MLAPRSLQNRLWGGAEPSQVGSIPIHPRHNMWGWPRYGAQDRGLTGDKADSAGFRCEAGNEAFDSQSHSHALEINPGSNSRPRADNGLV